MNKIEDILTRDITTIILGFCVILGVGGGVLFGGIGESKEAGQFEVLEVLGITKSLAEDKDSNEKKVITNLLKTATGDGVISKKEYKKIKKEYQIYANNIAAQDIKSILATDN